MHRRFNIWYLVGLTVSQERIERLWCDVWSAVTYLQCFLRSWNFHHIRSEGNLSPAQLWHIGMLQTPVEEPRVEALEHLFQDHCSDAEPDDEGAVVSAIMSPLSEQNLTLLQGLVNPVTSALGDRELYIQTLYLVQILNQ
ncbi:hypothetical protein CHARACLAT_012007 [Characodon lateralis]|uniref:Uncharacterized protein n=1 Tax=Characodon lateralis TaxID=208331 RepID=A0ABU7EVU0_9TELE|nr:hypothetical protein [Characodon lateralis]